MSLDSERAKIEAHFLTGWDAAQSPAWSRKKEDGRLGFDGQDFSPSQTLPSVEVEIAPGDSVADGFGSPGTNLARYAGVAIFRIRVIGGNGTKEIRDLADTVSDIMRNQTIDNIRTRIPYVQTRVSVAPFLGWSIAVPFERDEYHA